MILKLYYFSRMPPEISEKINATGKGNNHIILAMNSICYINIIKNHEGHEEHEEFKYAYVQQLLKFPSS